MQDDSVDDDFKEKLKRNIGWMFPEPKDDAKVSPIIMIMMLLLIMMTKLQVSSVMMTVMME